MTMGGMTKDEIKAELSMEIVAEELQIPMERKGRSLYCLCPWHDDRHFGSCYVEEHAIHCRACGKIGDIYTVIQTVRGCSFVDAMKFAAEMLGVTAVIQSNHNTSDINAILSQAELQFLGIRNERVRPTLEITSVPDTMLEYKMDVLGSESIVYGKSSNTLLSLNISDFDEYQKLIDRFVDQKEKALLKTLDLMVKSFGEMGYMAVLPHFYKLRDIQRKLGEITVKIPKFNPNP